MASCGHIAVGLAGARLYDREWSWGRAAAFSGLAMLPDLDVIGFRLGVPYGAPFGHRGASHSLAAAVAVGVLGALLARPLGLRPLRTGLWVFALVASHGLLDTLTDGGKGVALLWPFRATRYFAPWRPIPVAPIGTALFTARGLRVLAVEALEFLPVFAFALWPRGRRHHRAR